MEPDPSMLCEGVVLRLDGEFLVAIWISLA